MSLRTPHYRIPKTSSLSIYSHIVMKIVPVRTVADRSPQEPPALRIIIVIHYRIIGSTVDRAAIIKRRSVFRTRERNTTPPEMREMETRTCFTLKLQNQLVALLEVGCSSRSWRPQSRLLTTWLERPELEIVVEMWNSAYFPNCAVSETLRIDIIVIVFDDRNPESS